MTDLAFSIMKRNKRLCQLSIAPATFSAITVFTFMMISRIQPQFVVHPKKTKQKKSMYCNGVVLRSHCHLNSSYFFVFSNDKYRYFYNNFSIVKAFLLISCLLLLATFVIYGVYRVKLLNYYTKIMMHYSALLFLSFLFLTINKFIHLGESSGAHFCQFTGKHLKTGYPINLQIP